MNEQKEIKKEEKKMIDEASDSSPNLYKVGSVIGSILDNYERNKTPEQFRKELENIKSEYRGYQQGVRDVVRNLEFNKGGGY